MAAPTDIEAALAKIMQLVLKQVSLRPWRALAKFSNSFSRRVIGHRTRQNAKPPSPARRTMSLTPFTIQNDELAELRHECSQLRQSNNEVTQLLRETVMVS
jgi:HAMP domain-containing protein